MQKWRYKVWKTNENINVCVEIHTVFLHFRKFVQKLKFYTYVTMSSTYTMASERSVNLLMRRELREKLQNTTFLLSLPGKTPIHLVRSLQFYSTGKITTQRLKIKTTMRLGNIGNEKALLSSLNLAIFYVQKKCHLYLQNLRKNCMVAKWLNL